MDGRQVLHKPFLDFMVGSGALLFGDFVLKSGRKSPFFINTGEYKTGAQLSRLGDFYAKLIQNSVRTPEMAGSLEESLDEAGKAAINSLISSRYNVLFGPAYKGIPLVTTTAIKLASDGLNLNVSFDRKERKDHGEGNIIMGYHPQPGDRIAIIEDVTSAGTSIHETIALLDKLGTGAKAVALYISVDRLERGAGSMSAIAQLKMEYGIETYSIVTIADIIDYLENEPEGGSTVHNAKIHAQNIREYLKEYGAAK